MITHSENTERAKIFHQHLDSIASGTDRELARYVEFLIEENKILHARIPGQVHTKPDERRRLVQLGKALGRASFASTESHFPHVADGRLRGNQ